MPNVISPEILPGTAGAPGEQILIIADHASALVPDDIELGIDPALLRDHIAIDVGVAEVSRLLHQQIGCGAVLAATSRLVIDLNREENAPGLIPVESDGHPVPGNLGANRETMLNRIYRPYHRAVSAAIDGMASPFLLSLHSFTPSLASCKEEIRPWDIGVLYNQDDRAARIAISQLQASGLNVGDQLPYSGTLLNATMNRHGEARGIPYVGIEMRQDHVSDRLGQQRFASLLAPILLSCRNLLA